MPADCLILDLEDSVAPDAKAMAREQIAQAVAAKGFGKREILIRTNSLDTPWWSDDVAMAGKVEPDGILVPKISTVDDLNTIGARLSELGADRLDQGLGHDRDRARGARCRQARRRLARSEDAACRLRVRAERHRAGDADQDACRAAPR